MESLFDLLNEEGVTIVASSRKGAEEVWKANDGRLFHVYHYKSGRDKITPTSNISQYDYLTVRYDPPKPAVELLREFTS